MAFSDFTTEDWLDNQRWTEFNFFTYAGVNGNITKNITMGKRYRVKEFRIHCSSAFASTQDLIVRFSHAINSVYNFKLLSYAMSGLTDLWVDYIDPLSFNSDDHMIVNLNLTSGTNTIGIEVSGWAVLG